MSIDISVARLTEQEQRRLGSKYPELLGGESALVISAADSVLAAVEELAAAIAWRSEQGERVLESMVDDAGTRVLDQPRVLQLHRQAEARAAFLKRYETLTSAEIAGLSRSAARNTSALANRWKAEGRIFAVPVGRTDRFPAFQFGDDGKPLPAITEVIRAFAGQGGWTLALWFAAPSGWLGGATPASVVTTDPAAVVEAAAHAVEPLDI
jgi:hypothetical protein